MSDLTLSLFMTWITSQGLSHINWSKEEKDFTFYVGSKSYHVNHIQAAFISPHINLLFAEDSTINEYHIATRNCEDAFELIYCLMFGKSIEVNDGLRPTLYLIGQELSNNEIAAVALKTEQYTIENVIPYTIAKVAVNIPIDSEVEFIANNFLEFEANKLHELDISIMDAVLKNANLSLTSETSLFDFLVQYIKMHPGSQHLLGNVYADYLDSASMDEYMTLVEEYQIYQHVWNSLRRRMIIDVRPKQPGHNVKVIGAFKISPNQTIHDYPYTTDMFNGIFKGIAALKGRDITELVTAIESSHYSNPPSIVLKMNNEYWSSTQSNVTPNQWITFDFKESKVVVESYSMIVTLRPKSWKVEGSNDNENFTLIDDRPFNHEFEAGTLSGYDNQENRKIFHVQEPLQSFRYIKVTQGTEGNWDYEPGHHYNHCFIIYHVELFGKYIE